jgi:sugar/nucleoside kinase (ribokinase family)
LQIKQGEKSFFWSGKYHNDMNSRTTLATELNVLADFDPILPASYQDAEYVLLGNLTPSIQSLTLDRLAKKPKLVVLDTMNFWMDVALQDLQEVLKRVDVLTINDEEARQLSGEYSLVKAAEKILTMGPRYLIIKKGEHGALLFGDGQIFSAPALPLAEVFDPTGAGDSFAGGFIGYLARLGSINFNNMKNALIVGSALASFCVESFGTARLQKLDEKEIAQRIKTFVQLSQFDVQL